jgi:hypothetical protein
MNDGAGGDSFTEIDASTINNRPAYMQHTTTAATTIGATYRFKIEAYNVVGSTFSESVGDVLADVPAA